jgi:hypothetical protein
LLREQLGDIPIDDILDAGGDGAGTQPPNQAWAASDGA